MKSNPSIAAAVVAAASFVIGSSAYALSPDQAKSITSAIQNTKVVEISAKAASLVERAAKADRTDTAVAVVSATAKTHPGALLSVISAVVKKDPQSAESVVKAALSVAPDHAESIVSAAVAAAPDRATSIAAVASKLIPSKTAVFEGNATTIASVSSAAKSVGAASATPTRQRQSLTSAAVITGGDISQNPGTGQIPVNLYAIPSLDPNRP